MIQTENDKKNNPVLSKAFGLSTQEEAEKLYQSVSEVWNSLDLPVDFEEICESSVRTALSMHLEDAAPLGLVLRGMASHLIIIGFKLAEMENNKQRTLN